MPVENQITTLSVVKIAIKFSPCIPFYLQFNSSENIFQNFSKIFSEFW